MKILHKAALITVLVIIVAGLLAGFMLFYKSYSSIEINIAGNSSIVHPQTLRYHFAVIAQNTDDVFWQSVKGGAVSAGQAYDAAVEFNGPVINDDSQEIRYLDMAITSKVDGIAVYPSDDPSFTNLINKAVNSGIPVVTMESDDSKSRRSAFVGINNFAVGEKARSLVEGVGNRTSNVGIILGGNYASDSSAKGSFLSGFGTSAKNSPTVKLAAVQSPAAGYFGSEQVIRKMLIDYPDINTVVCTTSDDTLEIAQVLIDLNKVGEISLIGFNYNTQIHDYIQNGLIYGSVIENPEQIGYQSIETLVKALESQSSPSFIDTKIQTVTKDNLSLFPDTD